MKKTTRRKANNVDAIEHLVRLVEEHLKCVLIACEDYRTVAMC